MPTAKKKTKKVKHPKKPVARPRKKYVSKSSKPAKKAARKLKSSAAARKPAKKPKGKKKNTPAPKPAWHQPHDDEVLVGLVEDYLSHLQVVLTTLKTPLAAGEAISIRGFTTNLEQTVLSMQIEHAPVARAGIGQAVGIKISEKVRKHDHIFKKK
jgi:hypothetical protein